MPKKQRSRNGKPTLTAKQTASGTEKVPRNEQQFVLIGDTLLDIELAHRLLRSKPRQAELIDVDAWARLYGMDGNPNSPIAVGPGFNRAHAMTADLSRPLILVTLVVNGQQVHLIADGSHRLFRAFADGTDHLPAYVLTVAETCAVTVVRPTR